MKLPSYNQSPEYRHALQELIKFEMQALVERLSATGEEALVLTASCHDGTSMQFGSQKAEGFLRKQMSLGQDFVTFCNDDIIQSSADEMCNSGDEIEEDTDQKHNPVDKPKQSPPQLQFSPHRQHERTNSKRISFTEDLPKDPSYEVSQNSDLSASERNDSASSVASFAEAQESKKPNTGKKSLQCKICSRNFRSYKTLNAHNRLHMAKSYKCAVCGKIFTLKKSYQRHIANHKQQQHMNKLYECGICDKSYADLNAWKRHREIHLEVRNYSCNLCGKAFVEKYSLRVHQTSHFYPSVKPQPDKNQKNTDVNSGYSCHICGKQSATKTAMNKHMLTHSAKKFTCEFCNKRFSVKYSYVRHRRLHTGERPYKCGFCERSFSDSSAWSKHVRTHAGSKQYSCDLCSKSFYDKTLCKTHMKRHQVRKNSSKNAGRNISATASMAEKRNFGIVSKIENSKFEQKNASTENLDFGNSDTNIYDEDVNLRLDVSDKESEDSRLLDSSFGRELLPIEDNKGRAQDRSPKKFPSLIENFGFDEKFQTDFVERNMPSKPLESDNEFISTAFADDSELLADETETDGNELECISSTYETESPKKNISHKPDEMESYKSERKTSRLKTTIGKYSSEWKCKKCNKKFNHESLLKQHLQFHCMMKLYKCRYCSKQLTTKQSLIRHERIHIGDRPYQCYVCQKTFADNHGCIRHINTHFSKDSRTAVSIGKSKPGFKPQSQACTLSQPQASINTTVTRQTPAFSLDVSQSLAASRSQAVEASYFGQSETVSVAKPLIENDSLIVTDSISAISKTHDSTLSLSLSSSKPSTSENQDKKQFFKCFRCPALFSTEKLCIDHIKLTCANKSPDQAANGTNKSPKQPVEQKLNNIYQCMLCLKMFSDKDFCQEHINNECQKRTPVNSFCDMPSILNDSESDPMSATSVEPLPELPFPVVTTEPDFLNSQEDELSFYTNANLTQTSDNLQSSNYAPVISTTIAQSSLVGTNSTLSVTQSTPAATKSPITVNQSTLSVAQSKSPVAMSASEKISGKAQPPSQQPGTLLFIPIGQVPGQSSATLCLQSANTVQSGSSTIMSTGEPSYTGLQQKPMVNIGPNKYLLTSHSIGLVGAPGMTATNTTATPGTQKSGKQKRAKSPESDLKERTCSICSKVFTTKHILKQHTLIHMERNFGCKFCMKKFHNKYGRDRHERIHTGETPFSCPTCKKAFSDNSTYRKHTWKCCSGK